MTKIFYLSKTKKTPNKDITTNQLVINNDIIISKNKSNLEKKKMKKIRRGNYGEVWLLKQKDLKK